ncbi:MAG: DNA alkylation repair protein [Pseudomonadota bacterium]|nr:DNA alkylation repair protein [Pseudomonadota bacterium]
MAALSSSSTAAEIIAHLRSTGSEDNRQGMRRYGISVDRALGIPHGEQRDIAKKIKRNHERALELWESGITEAQFIASLTADPKRFTKADARRWAAEFDSWDIVDGVSDFFVDTDHWRELIAEFAVDEREFVRRAAFAMIAWAVVHRKKEADATFVAFLPLIRAHSQDDRNFVKKAVSWALRSIGKRNMNLNESALELAEKLATSENRTARWTGRQAIRDLTGEKTRARLEKKEKSPAKA